jgi:post-segregation antitoxin (ccd killing protein)
MKESLHLTVRRGLPERGQRAGLNLSVIAENAIAQAVARLEQEKETGATWQDETPATATNGGE